MGPFYDYLIYKIESINSINDYEYITLITSFNCKFLDSPVLDCRRCLTQFDGQRHSDKRLENLQLTRGCKEIKQEKVMELELGNFKIKYFTCAGNFYDRVADLIEIVHSHYEKGHMPEDGGILDQCAKFVELMELWQNLKIDRQEVLRKEHEKQQKRNAHKWQKTR